MQNMHKPKLTYVGKNAAWEEAITDIEKRKKGEVSALSTGFPLLDKVYFDGFETGWIVSISGPSGTGKTAFVAQLLDQMAESMPKKVAYIFFSFEMRPSRMLKRMLCRRYQVNMRELYFLEGYKGLSDNSLKKMKEGKVPLMDEMTTFVERPLDEYEIQNHISKFRERVDEEMGEGTPIVAVIDHLLLARNATRKQGIDDVMLMQNELKKLDPNILFLNITQLNRNYDSVERHNPDKPQSHYPVKSDLYGSDIVWMTSDAIIVLTNPYKSGLRFYGVDNYYTFNNESDLPYIFAHNLKNRDAGQGGEIIPYIFKGSFYEFQEANLSNMVAEASDDSPF